ncbi:MAG TPA: hypothetical protein VK915_01215 [Gaiellaceae bacterium]|nr:hypothetical protein [Gaiellaceae bacterium]
MACPDWILLDGAIRRALEVQRELAPSSHGNYRRPAVDFLIGGDGRGRGDDVTLWFFDRDLRVICEHTGQPYEAEVAA